MIFTDSAICATLVPSSSCKDRPKFSAFAWKSRSWGLQVGRSCTCSSGSWWRFVMCTSRPLQHCCPHYRLRRTEVKSPPSVQGSLMLCLLEVHNASMVHDSRFHHNWTFFGGGDFTMIKTTSTARSVMAIHINRLSRLIRIIPKDPAPIRFEFSSPTSAVGVTRVTTREGRSPSAEIAFAESGNIPALASALLNENGSSITSTERQFLIINCGCTRGNGLQLSAGS